MIIKVCDRCGRQYRPPLPFMQAKLPTYKITKFETFPGIMEIDLCNECQDDFAKWMNELKVKSLDCTEVNNDESAKL